MKTTSTTVKDDEKGQKVKETKTTEEAVDETPINTDNPYGLEEGEEAVYIDDKNIIRNADGEFRGKAPKRKKKGSEAAGGPMSMAKISKHVEVDEDDDE